MKLSQFPETLAVVRLGPGAEVPRWASEAEPYRMMGGIVQYSNPAAYGPVVAPPIGANCAYRRDMFRKTAAQLVHRIPTELLYTPDIRDELNCW